MIEPGQDPPLPLPPEGPKTHKAREDFRSYESPARATVRELYRLNHQHQTYALGEAKRKEYLGLRRATMGVWEAMEYLDTLVDDSDPDIELSQLEHLLQTAEAIRADGHPDWLVLTGLVHDLGKVLCLWGEPQWAVVGDTFPVGCGFRPSIVYPELFAANPDTREKRFHGRLGVYEDGCGLANVRLSWGHDEYMYHVVKDQLPEPALYVIRYHSFYAAHRERDYEDLMDDRDKRMFEWVRAYNPYDLYSKSPVPKDAATLRPYYEALIAKYLPAPLRF